MSFFAEGMYSKISLRSVESESGFQNSSNELNGHSFKLSSGVRARSPNILSEASIARTMYRSVDDAGNQEEYIDWALAGKAGFRSSEFFTVGVLAEVDVNFSHNLIGGYLTLNL